MQLPQKLPWDLASTQWAKILNPFLANLLANGNYIPELSINNGMTVVNHGLGRSPQGWFLVAPKGAATVYQSSAQPNPTLNLTITSNAAIQSGLWVF